MDTSTEERVSSSPPIPTKEGRLAMMQSVVSRLLSVAEQLESIERDMAVFPDVVKENSLGVAVDLVSEIKGAIEQIHGDGSSVITNRVKARLNYIREVTLPERFDDEGIKTFNTERFRVTRTAVVMASIIPDHRDEAFQWLRDNDMDSLIKETVNASSLSSLAKEMMSNGEELPDDHFRTHMKDNVSITKLKPKRA